MSLTVKCLGGRLVCVGEYIFETLFKPINKKSDDSQNDCHTYEKYEVGWKNEHNESPSFK